MATSSNNASMSDLFTITVTGWYSNQSGTYTMTPPTGYTRLLGVVGWDALNGTESVKNMYTVQPIYENGVNKLKLVISGGNPSALVRFFLLWTR